MSLPFVMVPGRERESYAEFRVSTGALPFLADHGFQGVTVLPGVFFLEMALAVHRTRSGGRVLRARNLRFLHPVLVSEQETVLGVEVSDGGANATYTVFELSGVDGAKSRRAVAELAIGEGASGEELAEGGVTIGQLQSAATESLAAGQFYERLRRNGNEYGGRFQTVTKVWRRGADVLGEICVPGGATDSLAAQTVLLDAVTQVLAPFALEQRRTMVLRAIEAIAPVGLDAGAALYCHAMRRAGASGDAGIAADVRVYRASGELLLRMDGVQFELLPREAEAEASATTLAVAANFTAEPVEEALQFWAGQFGLPVEVAFAPYDQLFQQLLSPESVLRRDANGANMILLQLERWAAEQSPRLAAPDAATLERCLGARRRYTLPNGWPVAHLNTYETEYLYKEVFEDRCYLKHGIRLPQDATVVDIGANVGMFTLFVLSRCAQARVYAYEPAPAVFDLLQANCAAYGAGGRAQAFGCGVSGEPGKANFTFYENSSVFSGFRSDAKEDLRAIQAVVRNVLGAKDAAAQADVRDLTAERLRATTHEVALTTVSEILRENRLEHVDLLKIDAEKSEEEILAGIGDEDWARIDQIVMELHDTSGEVLERVRARLEAKGYRCAVEHEEMLEHSGLFNLFASRLPEELEADSDSPEARGEAGLRQNVGEFAEALRSFAGQSKAPMVVCLCPAIGGRGEMLAAAEGELIARIGGLPGVTVIPSGELQRMYPVAEYYDPHGHQLGDIPYSKAAYAAMGTAAFRKFFRSQHRPFKVIALDCDHTLWQGVCGEDGPQGVVLSAPYVALQEFMLRQAEQGMLLCLCSKNNEADVFAVLEQRAEMRLKREHLAAWRINWSSKAENLAALAQELNLGLDSFIFVDDNPVECAEVESRCPGVLTLRLPQEAEAIPAFLEHVWAFDQRAATEEDRQRTRMYQDNARRERFRAEAPSLRSFLEGLQVRTVMAEMAEEDVPRVSQLTYRTNQFNFTAIRRTEAEVREFRRRDGAGCLTVRVADRFGDYGLVGVVLYEQDANCLRVDSLLLSCRVLGRGVEHAIVARLGEMARAGGKEFVQLRCVTTERNLPARDFVRSLGDAVQELDDGTRVFRADALAKVVHEPSEMSAGAPVAEEKTAGASGGSGQGLDLATPGVMQRIAEEWRDAGRIAEAAAAFRGLEGGVAELRDAAPAGSMEEAVERIWAQVLGRRAIGLDVNFFEAGGTSLKAVQVIAMMRKQMECNLSVISLFESPTVRLLAERLKRESGGQSEAAPSSAAQRGQQRRERMTRPVRRS